MNMDVILPVILCGGRGSRLWPLSRKSFPKQFLAIGNDNKKSLLQKTYERIASLKNVLQPLLICNEENRFIAAEQFREINIKPSKILLEPFGRGTAPSIILAALKSMENGNDPILLILPSDHEIEDPSSFINSIESGTKYAKEGRLVTFGVKPNSPETGYGYIESNELSVDITKGEDIKRFIEKPSLDKAKRYFESNRYSWNSGIFLFKASKIISEAEHIEPNILRICSESIKGNLFDLDFQRINKKIFSSCPNISIDNAIMEKTKLGTVVPLNCGWNDIGSWNKVWENSNKDLDGNFKEGNVLIMNSSNSYFKSDNRMIVGVGLNEIIVVETSDAILVLNKSYAQKIKDIVKELNNQNYKEAVEHKKTFRPWGNYTNLVEDSKWKVKKIVVNPKESLSLQKHNHRSEHWVVVKGKAKVEIDKTIKYLSENQSAYISSGSKHRLTNPSETPLVIIEVQSGSFLEESDIIRFEDNYGRI